MRHLKLALFATNVWLFWAIPVHGLTTSITLKVPSAAVTNSTKIKFEFTSSASDARFMCALDHSDPMPCTSPHSYAGLADGSHHFLVFALNETEGVDTTGDTHVWRIDTVAPKTRLTATPVGRDAYTFDLFANEANSTFVCSLNGGPVQPCATPVAFNNLPDGQYIFLVQAVDEAGNLDPVGADYVMTISSAPPITTSITRITPEAEFTNSTGITFEFESNHSNATFVCTLAGQPSACTPPFSYARLPDALYEFKVQAVDAKGAMDPVGASYSWTVDTVPPTGSVIALESTSTSITISWTTNEPATTNLSWGKDTDLSRGLNGDGNFRTTHTLRLTGLSSNTPYSLQPKGIDRAGNAYALPPVSIRTKR